MRRIAIIFTVQLTTLIIILPLGNGQDVKCAPKEFEKGNIACVCNSTYCDTITPVPQLTLGSYWHVESNKAGLRFNKTKGLFNQTKGIQSAQIKLRLDHNKAYQTIYGFGGAFTDSATINIMKLTKDCRQKLMDSYFSTNGVEYTIGRVNIGGCDFSTRPYTYNDDQDGDFNLTHFSLVDEDLNYKIPLIQQALQMSTRPIRMFASAWSAPAWMKTNNKLNETGTLKGKPGKEFYQTWALYYLKFLEAYKQHGIKFWAITAQNEPTDGYMHNFKFNCLGFTASEQRIFIESNLGPTLEKNGFSDVEIIMLDDLRYNLPFWALEVLAENYEAKNYVKGIGLHWYVDKFVPGLVIDATHYFYPNKYFLMTEACEGAMPWDTAVIHGSWERGENYANNIIDNLSHWVVGWVDWNIALDTTGGPNWSKNEVDSPILVNETANEFYKQPMYYAIGHFSKFVPPGCVVIESKILNIFEFNLISIAFDCPNEGSTVMVILNKHSSSKTVEINDSNVGKITTVLSANSINTLIWRTNK